MIKYESVSYCDFCKLPKQTVSVKLPVAFYESDADVGVEIPFVQVESKDICSECFPKVLIHKTRNSKDDEYFGLEIPEHQPMKTQYKTSRFFRWFVK